VSVVDRFGKKLIQSRFRPIVNQALHTWGRFNAKRYDIRNTIVIASSPRGGSTWLAEIIGTLPGYPILWEPLHLNGNPECKEYGFSWQTFVPSGAQEPIKRDYLCQVLTGVNPTQLTYHPLFQLTQYLPFRGFVVKFTNANLLLPWLLHQFPLRTILMIRHPCAVVSSQMRHWAWDGFTENTVVFPKNIIREYPHLEDVFYRIGSREEALAFEWALQTLVPLTQPLPHPWCLVSYERLIEEGPHEIDRLFEFLGFSVPEEAYKQLEVPSVTTQTGSNIAKGNDALSGWRERLTTEQVDSILSIVRQVGVDFYDEALTPNYVGLGLS
jgi:hypothetical protein